MQELTYFFMLALLRRTSFWPPSMVYKDSCQEIWQLGGGVPVIRLEVPQRITQMEIIIYLTTALPPSTPSHNGWINLWTIRLSQAIAQRFKKLASGLHFFGLKKYNLNLFSSLSQKFGKISYLVFSIFKIRIIFSGFISFYENTIFMVEWFIGSFHFYNCKNKEKNSRIS